MRRTQLDDSRRRQAASERRFRGHRIRGGLDELKDLDAPPQQKVRKDTPPTSAATSAPTAVAAEVAVEEAESSLLSSSTGVCTTVFGSDWSEWLEVKRVLFDAEATVEARRAALGAVRVWHLRARKERQLPPYVEATEVLLDAMLQDESNALADGPLRMCYGAAISRVVHTMTGSFANGSADTYRKRAHEIGFPEEAVEVRQRVAHGVLPLTSELRWVCGLALQFLFTEYWLEQERQLYLMEQVDKTAIVRSRDAQPETSAKKRKGSHKAERGGAAAAAVSQPAVPPPNVSMDDMKALLADLEDSDNEAKGEADCDVRGKALADAADQSSKDAVIAQEKDAPGTAVATSEGSATKKPASRGWVIS